MRSRAGTRSWTRTAGSSPTSPASAEEPSSPVGADRRVAAGVLDALLLGLGFGLLSITELALASEQEADIALYAWVFALAPLYFALYHAYGTGATPGQLELRIGLRDARSGKRPGLARALARSLLGLVFLVTVVPALVELALLLSGRSLRDRLTRTRVEAIRLHGKAPQLA
ncbi:MAG TPA: RDD family protein, partial [Gaiellaceae bacterium]|nr:RDD family protein [Gaiellaceae bacterium]